MRLWLCMLLFCAAVTGFGMAPAYAAPVAADTAHAETAADGHGTAHKKSGMPQFDVTRFPSQIFWLLITFALTYVLMRYLALPGVEQTLESRAARIAKDVTEAKALNEEAKRLMAEHETRLHTARGQALDVTRAAADESAKKAAQVAAQQQQALDVRLQEAEKRIASLKAEATVQLEKETAVIVTSLVERLSGLKPGDAAVNAALLKVKEA